MIKHFLILFFTITGCNCIGQNNFEGIIKYKAENNVRTSEIEVSNMDVFFKANLIKISISDFNKFNSTWETKETITNFTTGIEYTIEKDLKFIVEDSIKDDNVDNRFSLIPRYDSTKLINKHNCHASLFNSNINTGTINGCIWLAEDLFFSTPTEYRPFGGYSVFTDGKNIGLGFSFTVRVRNKTSMCKVEAIEISEKSLSDSIFSLPTGYKSYSQKEFYKYLIENFTEADKSLELLDTEMIEIKTEKPPPPPPPPDILPIKKDIKKKATKSPRDKRKQ